ncbi:MAG: trigger factor [Bacilli bacterium]|nr:trigger factor [Bacilli bacterium]
MSNKHVVVKKVDGDAWKEALNKSFEKNVKKVKVDGFREGKCPRNIFEKKYGVESLYNDAVDMILPNLYSEVLTESKLVPVVQPSIDIKSIDKNGVEIEFTIITEPEVKIKKYTGLGVKREKAKVSAEEVETEINRLREQYAEIEIKEGKIKKGDTAVIDFEGFKDGVAFDGGKGENYPLEIGSNTFIPGFEDALIGLKTGDKKDINLTFPEDYPSEELKGQAVVFKVTVHEVKTRKLPEINEEFFDDIGIENVNSLEELKKHIKKDLTEQKEKSIDNKFIDEILEAVRKETTIDIPDELVHEEIHRMLDTYDQRLHMQGLSLDQYLQFSKKSIDDLEEELKPEAEKNITYRYMMEEIAKKEKIDVTDKEREEETERLAKMYQMTKEELVKAFGGKDMVGYDLKMRKALEFLKENN